MKCNGASELASRAMDERLPLTKRMVLKLHQVICANCARFARQLKEIRRLLHMEQAASNDDVTRPSREARQRIEAELQKKLD